MEPPLIVVVDDDEPFLELMQAVLTEEGYRVAVNRSAGRATEQIVRLAPALVILDLLFPFEVDGGLMLLRRLRENPLTATVPVLICSAATVVLRQREAEFSSLRAAMLAKPFNLDDLTTRVAQLLRLHHRNGNGAGVHAR